MADQDIIDVWKEFEAEDNAIHQMGQNMQLLYEQAIGNIAAMKAINDADIEESVKNS